MRQGVTGLIVGLVAGAVLASGVAFATGMVVSPPPGPRTALTPGSDGPVVKTRSVDPTPSAEATRGPDVRPPVAAEQRAGSSGVAKTRDRKHSRDRKSRSSQSVRPSSGADSYNDTSRGTVCAPTPVPDHEPGEGDHGSADHDMGERHGGTGHE